MKPTSQERIAAALAHLSAVLFGAGLALPAILWSENRRKSPYLRFQTLQALGYQSLGYTIWMLALLAGLIFFYILLFVIALLSPNTAQDSTLAAVLTGLVIIGMFGMFAIYILFPLIGAILCGLGKEFRYPVLGTRLAHFLGEDTFLQPTPPDASLDPASDERFAAAMAHFAVIIPLWGLFAPAWFWLTHENHSPWFKTQATQTALYQLFVNLLYVGLTLLAIISGALALVFFAAFMDLGVWIGVAAMMVMLCMMGITSLTIPLFHILGQWAGLQTLRGRNFYYPLLGKIGRAK